MILSAGNGLSASNTVSYAYDSIGRLGLNPSYNHLNLTGEIGAASGDQRHYTHVYDGTKLRAVIDGDTGTVVEASDYYPFGKRIQVTAPVSEPVGGSQYAAEPAVAPVAQAAPATSVASTSSPNRWLFSGKESQSSYMQTYRYSTSVPGCTTRLLLAGQPPTLCPRSITASARMAIVLSQRLLDSYVC